MSSIKKTYEQIQDFNIEGTKYLKKAGVLDDMAQPIKDAKKTKLNIAIYEILAKQVAKKIFPGKEKAIQRLKIKFAMVDPNSKELLIAIRANPRQGIPYDIYKFTQDNTLLLDEAIDTLEKTEVEIHQRSIPKGDMPEITDEEKEAFEGYIITE